MFPDAGVCAALSKALASRGWLIHISYIAPAIDGTMRLVKTRFKSHGFPAGDVPAVVKWVQDDAKKMRKGKKD